MTTLLFNYSDILLPHLVAKFPQYNIIHDFKKINIKLKTLIFLNDNELSDKTTKIFMKKFLKQCQNIVVIIKAHTLPKQLTEFKKYFSFIDNCVNYLQRGNRALNKFCLIIVLQVNI